MNRLGHLASTFGGISVFSALPVVRYFVLILQRRSRYAYHIILQQCLLASGSTSPHLPVLTRTPTPTPLSKSIPGGTIHTFLGQNWLSLRCRPFCVDIIQLLSYSRQTVHVTRPRDFTSSVYQLGTPAPDVYRRFEQLARTFCTSPADTTRALFTIIPIHSNAVKRRRISIDISNISDTFQGITANATLWFWRKTSHRIWSLKCWRANQVVDVSRRGSYGIGRLGMIPTHPGQPRFTVPSTPDSRFQAPEIWHGPTLLDDNLKSAKTKKKFRYFINVISIEVLSTTQGRFL